MSPIVAFLLHNQKDCEGRTLQEVLSQSNEYWEYRHDFIQWVFPLSVPSAHNPKAPILTPVDIQHLQCSDMQVSVDRYLQFLRETQNWKRGRDHNHLRISRVLQFLVLINRLDLARQVYDFVIIPPTIPVSTKAFWAAFLPLQTENL